MSTPRTHGYWDVDRCRWVGVAPRPHADRPVDPDTDPEPQTTGGTARTSPAPAAS